MVSILSECSQGFHSNRYIIKLPSSKATAAEQLSVMQFPEEAAMNAFVLYLSGKICILLWVLSIKVVNIVDIAVVHLMKLSFFSGIIRFAPLDPSKNKNRKHLKSSSYSYDSH